MATFTANHFLAQLGALTQTAGSAGLNAGSRATLTLGNRPYIQRRGSNTAFLKSREVAALESASLAVADVDTYQGLAAHNWSRNLVTHDLSVEPIPFHTLLAFLFTFQR